MLLEKLFKSIMENVSDGILGIDRLGNLLVINNRAEELLGVSGKYNVGKHIEKVLPNTNLSQLIKDKGDKLNEEFSYNERKFMVNKIMIGEDDKIEGGILVLQDVTTYKELQNEMNEDKLYIDILDTVMSTVNSCVVCVDEKGIITMMSDAYKEFLNCDSPEGKHVTEVIQNTRIHKVLETGNTEVADLQEINGRKTVAMRVPIKKDGRVVGAVGKIMFKDIKDFHFLSKKLSSLEKEIEFYRSELCKERKAKYSFEDIIGTSIRIHEVKKLAKNAGKTDSNVLIVGESGTGKELFAHAIHNSSKRRLGPFVRVNCAAIPAELLEAELFGYEEGAFTGARKGGKKGKFELADGGSIFLDEIGDMPIDMQVKILRVIQEREMERIGGSVLIKLDIRIIAATNKNLKECIDDKKFREDLYYRLNVINIGLPPLRERKEDIPMLADALRAKVASRLDVYVDGISKEAINCLIQYDWPGNIRELENVIERAINLLDSDLIIKPDHLPEKLINNEQKDYSNEYKFLKDMIEEVERKAILRCLKDNNWNKNKTAKLLGISRAGLYKKIEEYNLESGQKVYM